MEYHQDYQRIENTINFIKQNFKQQPNLDELAERVNLSPFHFQRMFTDWAGVSPKKFLQYISIEHAKKILQSSKTNLFDLAFETGLSGTGRLYDLFVKIEGMTPGEYKNGGENLNINYHFSETPFGQILVATTAKGVCYMAFENNDSEAYHALIKLFPKANLQNCCDAMQEKALSIFKSDWSEIQEVKLHLKGTDFQIKVWETLLKIPLGLLTTYGDIATEIKHPKASRAVGRTIGSNPVAFLIPCHRTIRADGTFDGYRWGTNRKTAIIGWEAAKSII